MDEYLNYKEYSGKPQGKRLKYHKPYWNEELTGLWKIMCEKEKQFLRYKGHSYTRRKHRQDFVDARHSFDKLLRQCERRYRRDKILEIEKVCTDDPNKFWSFIKQLGPKKPNDIPKVIRGEKGMESEPGKVSNIWKSAFSKLLNPVGEASFDEDFLTTVKQKLAESEHEMDTPAYNGNVMINSAIDFDEVKMCSKIETTESDRS